MSGGGGQSTTQTGPPSWAVPFGQMLLGATAAQVFPNGVNGGVAPYNPGLNQQVAPFSDLQNLAMNNAAGATGWAQNFINQAANTNNAFASGAFAGPNPYLNQYYNQAANQDVQNYMNATQPALQAQFQRAGALDSSGFREAQGQLQYGLGQSLATLGANIYEPAYQQGMQNMLNAAQYGPTSGMSLFMPSQELFNIGQSQQQQQQNQLNANQQNTQQQVNWPFAMLAQLGNALGQATQGAGVSISKGPAGGK